MSYRNSIALTIAATTVCFLKELIAIAPSVNKTVNAFKDAFNDPSIAAYANEQGEFLPDSPTTSLPKPPAPAKSLSQSTTSSR